MPVVAGDLGARQSTVVIGIGRDRGELQMAMIDEGDHGPMVDDPDTVRAEWLGRLHALADEVKGWVDEAGWRTRLVAKPTRDSVLGRFEVPLLLMERDGVQVALNPVSRFIPGAEGAVDLYLVPAYDEVGSLYLKDGRWTLNYAFRDEVIGTVGEADSMPLTEESILKVLDAMAARDE